MSSAVPKQFVRTVIEPSKGFIGLELLEVWKFRQLVGFFLWRDVLVRYKQTVLGVVWVVMQPLCMALVFSVLFGKFGKLPSDGVPYPAFTYCALLAWQYFSFGVSQASGSLVAHRGLITKVYFPRMIVPLSSILPGIVDFLVGLVVFIPILLWYQIPIKPSILLVGLLLPLLFITTLGPALWFSALVGYYRDFRIVVPFVLQFLMFLSPVAYGAKMVPQQYEFLYSLNPMVGIIEGFRWALLGTANPPWQALGMSVVVSLLVLCSGGFYFKQVEKGLADVV